MKRIEMIVRRSDALEFKTVLRSKPAGSKYDAIRQILVAEDSPTGDPDADRTFIAKLVTSPDGTGAVVAVGLGSWLTDEQFDHLKDVRNEIPAAVRERIAVRAGDPETFTGDFWDWAQSLSLYPQEIL